MPLTQTPITGRVVLPDDTAFTGGVLKFTLSGPDTESQQAIPAAVLSVTLDGDDIPAGFALWPNTEGERGTSYVVTLDATITTDLGGGQSFAVRKTYTLGSIQVGAAASYTLGELLRLPVGDAADWARQVRFFATRAAFVTWDAGVTPTVGTVVTVGGLSYRYIGTGTAIADLPGWVPNGAVYPDHWADNTPRVTDMTAAIQAAITYVGTFPTTSQGRDPVLFMGREYIVTETINITKDFTVLRGVGSRNTLIVPLTDFGVVLNFAAADPTVLSIGEPCVEGIGFRRFGNSSNSIAMRFVRAIGADLRDVKINYLSGGILIEGGINHVYDSVHYVYTSTEASYVPGTFAFKFREGPVATNQYPSNIWLVNCDLRSDSQINPRLDCGLDVGSCDGIFFTNTHILGGIGKGNIYCNPQVTALSPSGSKVTWLEGNYSSDGGSSYGIYFAAVPDPDNIGDYLTPTAYGVIQLSGIFSRQEVNHIYVEEGATVTDVKIDGEFRYAGDSGIVLMGGSDMQFTGRLIGAGANGNAGVLGEDSKKSGVVLGNAVIEIEIDLHLTNPDPLTMTTGVQVLAETVDFISAKGSAFGVPTPVLDDFSFISGSNTGSKSYNMINEKRTVYNVSVSGGAIQRAPFAEMNELDPSDSSDITGGVRRYEGAIMAIRVRSTRWLRYTGLATGLRLRGLVDVQAVDGDVFFFRYSALRGWVEISRTTTNQSFHGATALLGKVGLGVASTLTIASGVVTVTSSNHLIDTEGAAASDDLVTIIGAADGAILIIGTADSARDVVVKNGTGNIFCGSDRTLGNVADKLMLIGRGSQWHMLSYADN